MADPDPANPPAKPPPNPSLDERLAPLRQRIDALDQQIVKLLNERAGVVIQVGEVKRDTDGPIYAPEREKRVLERVRAHNHQHPETQRLPDACLDAIYRELMSGSFALERPLRIGYLGPAGSFSHAAATAKFGASVEYDNLADIGMIFDAVSRRHIDYGLVPIENSTEGSVNATLDGLLRSEVSVCAEVLIAIHHNLMANCSAPEITAIHSHPQALAQCRNWLNAQFPKVERVACSSTSRAVQLAAETPDAAAIGSALAGRLFSVNTQFEAIEDNPNNTTRFFILGHQKPAPSGDDKTTLFFTTKHQPGALTAVLDVFRDAKVNLTHIDKRPSQSTNWEYTFFVDLIGHRDDPKLQAALQDARAHCQSLKVLGSFPRAQQTI
ncbi:MAG: prephenate dehydratase [Planctomycetota bacterium]